MTEGNAGKIRGNRVFRGRYQRTVEETLADSVSATLRPAGLRVAGHHALPGEGCLRKLRRSAGRPSSLCSPAWQIGGTGSSGDLASSTTPHHARARRAEARQTPTRGDAKKASPLAWKSSSRAIQIRLHTTLTQQHPSRQTRYATPQFTR